MSTLILLLFIVICIHVIVATVIYLDKEKK